MRRRSQFNSTGFKIRIGALAIIAIFGGVFLIQLLDKGNDSGALSATEFKAGRIIDDSVFYNPNTMTAAEIDAFIDSHTSACDTWGTQKIGNTRFYGVQASNNTTRAEYMKYMRNAGYTQYHDAPFICIRDYYENPKTHKTNFETGGKVEPGMISAGQIIYNAAHEYNVNPQVLLVMLKKESYAWGDDWPLKFEYNTVMGYGCPDNAACDQDYFGFYNQVMTAAWQLNYYREHPNDYRYRPGRNVNIYYSPDYSCGTKSVYIENYATAGLYIYTPYTPNDAALANYPGTAWCGSYGNRNFYMYFREWFGSTLGTPKEEAYFPDGDYYIVSAQSPNEALQPEDGSSEKAAKYTLKQRDLNDSSIFRLERQSDGNYSFINKSNGLALDVYGGKLSAGSTISQWEAHRGGSQKFKVINNNDGTYSLSVYNNSSIVVSYNNEEDSLSLSWFSDSEGQKFRFIHTEAPVEDGFYHIVSEANTEKVIDIHGGNIAKNGANVEIYSNHNGDNQTFYFKYDAETGYYRLTPKYSENYSIDVTGASTKSLTNVELWSNNSTCAQYWQVDTVKDKTIRLISSCSGLSLDIEGGTAKNGANLIIYPYHGTKNQLWTLEAAIEETDEENNIANPDNTSNNNDNNTEILSGAHHITSAVKNNFAIDITGISSANGTNIELWSKNNSAAQVFNFTFDPNTQTYRISDTYTNRSLDVSSGVSKNGANVIMWTENGNCNQRWVIQKNEDNTYSILESCNGRALDIFGGNFSNGTNIGIWDYHGSNNQKWTIE